MEIISDLHIHSAHSRGTSKDLNLASLEKWARVKGVHLLGTGDFTHPVWIKELKSNLTEENGILKTKTGFPFLWQTEISLIYSQDNKGRRIHNVVLAPNFEVVQQITDYLKSKGRVDYDGRPIFGISCVEFAEKLMSISKDIEIIPAHCLLPGTYIHSNQKLKKIEEIKENDKVLTHKGKFKKVLKTFKRGYSGKIYKIIPWYFREGLVTTAEHPFYAIKSFKNCASTKGTCKQLCSKKDFCQNKFYENYQPAWIQAKDLEKKDFLVYPRVKEIKEVESIKISDFVDNCKIEDNLVYFGTNKKKPLPNIIRLNKNFCRLIGYYLAEGYTRQGAIAFSFKQSEVKYIEDVKFLMYELLGIKETQEIKKNSGIEIEFYSIILNRLFSKLFYDGEEKRAWTKILPEFCLDLPIEKQKEIFLGWWRGDAGYTTSKELSSQMKIVCLRLGIIPSISEDTAEAYNKRGKHYVGERNIIATRSMFIFSNLSFFENKDLLADPCFKKFINKRNMKHGWLDENYVYLPIKEIKIKEYDGEVYNLEVEDDNSYVAEFAAVHNCWTPWFGVLGSKGGFNSLQEAFGDQVKNIHAIETGLSSDPEMNWRYSQMDKFAFLSFSDLHSYWPWRIGREATVFDLKELTYQNIVNSIRNKTFKETIEVDPGYGKYHLDGHRNCRVCFSPSESKKHENLCPKCHRGLTIGVLNRIEELADRPEGFIPKDYIPFKRIIPLSELIAGTFDFGFNTKTTWHEYWKLVKAFDTENNVLLKTSLEELKKITHPKLAETIVLNREGKIKIKPGYDGEYGQPVLEKVSISKQKNLIDF